MIGGNTEAVLQQKTECSVNAIGERVHEWSDANHLWGWLDLTAGESKFTYDTKLQESTHIFICDYLPLDRHADNKRMVINGNTYNVLLIDDPMELHQHLEIYLKYTGR